MENMQKSRDSQADQMRLYQAELQEKKQLDTEIKRLKQELQSAQARQKDLLVAAEEGEKNKSLLGESLENMIKTLENTKQDRAKEISELIGCINLVTLKGKDKQVLVELQSRVKDDNLKMLKPFLEANKIKL